MLSTYGCNMAFTRHIIEKMEFSRELGRKGNLLLAGEEWELFFRIQEIGGHIVYLPKATVFHRIMQDRGEKQ